MRIREARLLRMGAGLPWVLSTSSTRRWRPTSRLNFNQIVALPRQGIDETNRTAGRTLWTTRRSSSLSWSYFLSLVGAGTAADAGSNLDAKLQIGNTLTPEAPGAVPFRHANAGPSHHPLRYRHNSGGVLGICLSRLGVLDVAGNSDRQHRDVLIRPPGAMRASSRCVGHVVARIRYARVVGHLGQLMGSLSE